MLLSDSPPPLGVPGSPLGHSSLGLMPTATLASWTCTQIYLGQVTALATSRCCGQGLATACLLRRASQ